MNKEHNEWLATHTGWLLLSPILIANIEDEAPVLIPRWRLWWWHDLNMWIIDNIINHVISLFDEDAVGYLLWGVRKLEKPTTVLVESE